MKIKEIKGGAMCYTVTFKPNWLEKLFGVKEKTEKFKQTNADYLFGGGAVYVRRDGSELGNGHWVGKAIDKFRKTW